MPKKALAIKNIGIEGPGSLGKYLASTGYALEEIDLQGGGACPANAGDYSAVIILGGPLNVDETEDYPFLLDEFRLIENCLKTDTRLIGICLGGQLIAKTLGAKVKPNGIKEIGWYDVKSADAGRKNSLCQSLPETFPAFHWHTNTFDIPNGAERLMESELCRNQAFTYGQAVALQFHLEVEADDIRLWSKAYADELAQEHGPDGFKKIEADTARLMPELKKVAARFYGSVFA
jgi:GMP synthase-like glutamine amidotransferase